MQNIATMSVLVHVIVYVFVCVCVCVWGGGGGGGGAEKRKVGKRRGKKEMVLVCGTPFVCAHVHACTQSLVPR